jgi:fatty-acyl-CoA synthase
MTAAAAPAWAGSTFGDALAWAAAAHGDREAVVTDTQRLTFRDLARRVRAFARGLVGAGIVPGEKVALWMSDRAEWLVARWAVPAIGAVLVPVNTRFRASDARYVLEQSDAATLIVEHGHRGVGYVAILDQIAAEAGALPALRRVVVLDAEGPLPFGRHSFAAVEAAGAACVDDGALDARMAQVRPDDAAQILYTSGTTSFPKGAQLCHGQLLQNNFRTVERMQLTPRDRYLSCVPLFSATGTGYTLSMLFAGAAMVIVDRFEAQQFCEVVQRERITVTFMVDAIVQDLRAFPRLADYDLSSLRTGTGAPLSPASFRFATDVIGIPQLIGVFGMSETSNAVARGDCRDPYAKRAGTNGRPVEGVRIRIADVESNATLEAGRVGEICVAGYVLMKGYYKLPEEDRKAFDAEGWLHTGDLGELDVDGYLIYRGRVKEMIKPGGFNVATQEIEVFLKTYPGVKEAVVVGVPDARLGEVGYAYVEVGSGEKVSGDALQEHCRKHIAGYKVPRYVEFVSDWPLTGSQKIRKLELKARAAQRIAMTNDA